MPKRKRSTKDTPTNKRLCTGSDVDRCKAALRQQLGEAFMPEDLRELEAQCGKLEELLCSCIERVESGSALLVGHRGSGKTLVVRRSLANVKESAQKPFMTVTLNGAVHTTDLLALREIARQLQLLQELETKKMSSFSGSLSYLLESAQKSMENKTTIVLILDEFDLFTEHSKQALLYNLFDSMHSGRTQMVVIGLTCRLDVVELLEKRVKSRFSHRQINFYGVDSVDSVVQTLEDRLLLQTSSSFEQTFNTEIKELLWSVPFKALIKGVFDITKDMRRFLSMASCAVSRLSTGHPRLEMVDFYDTNVLLSLDSRTELLKGVSILELCLIIAMKSLHEKGMETINFALVFDEYSRFASRSSTIDSFSKPVALKAFEHLLAMELVHAIRTAASSSALNPKEYREVRLMLESVQVTDAVRKYPHCPTAVKQWGTQWDDG